ncbi:MAG TPA: DNA recombination protein RmuC [Gammaproteobacteria bacterium]|jgi:DNA recombination protein RmuC
MALLENGGSWLLGAGFAGGLLLGAVIAALIAIRLKHKLVVAESRLAQRTEIDEEREQVFSLATERLSRTFDQLAQAQFQSHSETFLKLARENLGTHQEKAKGELAAREQAIENLLRPIRETMQRTERQLHELDKARRESYGDIKSQLEAVGLAHKALSDETRNLVNALRRPEVRGQWGEITLQRLVELAGMQKHCDFLTQSHQATEDGAIRPDMIVNLPEGRQLVVDVKTPLDAYIEATEATDESARKNALLRHSNVVSGRVRELASKAYWSQFDRSPEFVILFIPGDQFLSAALNEKPELLDTALRQNIILATPTSLVALLKAIAYGWQQVALTENAAQIRKLAIELYERLSTYTGHISDIGKELDSAVKAYNRSVGSLERMVLPSARRFTELGIQPKREIPATTAIETALRAPQHQADEQQPPDPEQQAREQQS